MDDFHFEVYTEFFHDLASDVFNESEHVSRGGTTAIDDKSRVFFGDLGTADTVALQIALLNESACKISLGALEDTSCAWKFQRLLFFSRIHALLTKKTDLLGVFLSEREACGKNGFSAFLLDAFSV